MYSPFLLSPLINLTFDHALPGSPCPFLGQIAPPPINIASTTLWQNAISSLTEGIGALPPVKLNVTSFALKVVSLHDPVPLFEQYNRATDHSHGEDGNSPVDGDTVFRIASTSKMFTVYALLLKCGFKCFEDPIAKYIPELANQKVDDSTMDVDWDDVTVGALAAQISGIGRDYSLGDIAAAPQFRPGSQFGLPSVDDLDPSAVPTCGANPSQKPCDRKESIRRMLQDPPSFPTYYTPSYSNMAYQLLGYVLENITGQPYEQVLQESVLEPLKLKHTSVSKPARRGDAVTMPNDPTYDWDQGDESPTGGIYASTNDLVKHALAVLNSTQLTASQVRRWLKPHSHFSPSLSFGAPWEIVRVPGVSEYHSVDIYTKSGSLGPSYTTLHAIIPDLQIIITANMLTSNAMIAASVLFSQVIQYTLKPLYDIAKAQALARFGGTYIDDRPHINSTITLATDAEIGLLVTQWISNGTDLLELLHVIVPSSLDVRLFPSSLTTQTKDGTEKIAFRATLFTQPYACVSWGTVDGLRWAGLGLDLLVFETEGGPGGKAQALVSPALRARYQRVEDGKPLRVQN